MSIKDARMEQIGPRHRPHYPPEERLRILEQRAAYGWSQEETARRFLVSTMTIHNWMRRLDDDGPDALVQVPLPVNRFPELVAYIVRRLKALCPRMGDRRIAQVTDVYGPNFVEGSLGNPGVAERTITYCFADQTQLGVRLDASDTVVAVRLVSPVL